MDTRPLILHVLHHLVIGGMENGLVNLINRLPRERWRHQVLCIEDYSEFRDRIQRSDVEVVALRRSQTGSWRLRRSIYQECRRLKPAIVHTRALSGLDALAPAWLAGGATLLHSEHGWNVDDLNGQRHRPAILRRTHSVFVDRFLAVSKDIQRYLETRVGIGADRIVQIYNGVDTERFRPGTVPERGALPAGFADERDFVVGTVGRLQAVKDQATLLRAAAELRRVDPELGARLRLVIVGGGPLDTELRSLSCELGIDAMTWFAGPLADVSGVLRSFNVFALPSLMEGTSNTLLEAMASGVPVIATPVGGNRELLREGEVGQFVDAGDAASLSAALRRYAADRALVIRHGRAARELAVSEFSIATMIERYDALYASLLALRKS